MKSARHGEGINEAPAAKDVVLEATAAAPQFSIGRWVNDTDMEAQFAGHALTQKSLWSFLTLAYASIGVIYGDIGTSPLYTMSSVFSAFTPTEQEILGATCLILWGLTLIVILKYCVFVLICDDNGEGGTFALYSMIARFAQITPGNSQAPDSADMQLSRYSSSNTLRCKSKTGTWLRNFLNKSHAAQMAVLILALVATSLVLGDSVLTPAQSVLGAVYGLQYKSNLSKDGVVGIACAVVVLLFAANYFGSIRIGAAYAPIVLLWFLFNCITAIHNIVVYYPGVFKAFSPYYGYMYFKLLRHTGWRSLSGIFLAFTGAEATFADIGHFGKNPVRASFLFIAYPVLMLTYLGQAAWMTKNLEQIPNTFFASIPFGPAFYWVFFIFAMLAACVASQAMISGAFQIIKQMMSLGCFPRLTLKHVSPRVASSVYIPEANWLMMVLTVVCIAIFRTTTVLGNAYGLCVSAMMFITTLLTSMVFLMVFDVNSVLVAIFFVVFGFIDCIFLSANLFKVPVGGWFAVAIAGGVFVASAIWWWGSSKKGAYIRDHKVKVEEVLETPDPLKIDTPLGSAYLCNVETGEAVVRVPGLALMYSDTVLGAPPLLPNLVKGWGAIHRNLVLVTVRKVLIPSVDDAERLLFSHTSLPGIYRAVVRYGYMETINHNSAFVNRIAEQIIGNVHERSVKGSLPEPVESAVDGLAGRPPIFILSQATVANRSTGKGIPNAIRRFFLEDVYGNMARFARNASDEWNLDPSQCFEVNQVFKV